MKNIKYCVDYCVASIFVTLFGFHDKMNPILAYGHTYNWHVQCQIKNSDGCCHTFINTYTMSTLTNFSDWTKFSMLHKKASSAVIMKDMFDLNYYQP